VAEIAKLRIDLIIKRHVGNVLPRCMKRRCTGYLQEERIAQYVFSCCLKVKVEEVKHI
jgi:hypothetical protein